MYAFSPSWLRDAVFFCCCFGGRIYCLDAFCSVEIFILTFCFGPPGKIIHDFNIAREGEKLNLVLKTNFREIRRNGEEDL
jgi:hypothetical protein